MLQVCFSDHELIKTAHAHFKSLAFSQEAKHRLSVFWFGWDGSGQELGLFPPANGSTQVRFGENKIRRLDVIQTGEKCRRGCSSEQKEI